MPNPEPQKTPITHPTNELHSHISDGSSGVLIDYGPFTVNQNGVEYTFDENDGINQYDSFYVYVWHMDIKHDGFAWIRFYYGDDDYDEFRHRGNGTREFWLKNEGIWSPHLGLGDATAYLPRMGISRQYIMRSLRILGTSTWEFVNLEPGLTKIVFMDQADWGGMIGIYILNYEILETPSGDGGGGGGNGTPILENPYYLNEYVYRQTSPIVDMQNQIPEWSNTVQNTRTLVTDTQNSRYDFTNHFTYFYDGYISFPVNTRKYFGLSSDDDSFMWIVEGDRLWSTVGHSHQYSAFSIANLIRTTGANNLVPFFIDDRENHGPISSYINEDKWGPERHRGGLPRGPRRTDYFDFEANKLYTILIKITENTGNAGLYFGISDSSLENQQVRVSTFPEYFGTGYTLNTINNPPITNPPTLEISFYDNAAPFDFDFSSRFTDPDGDNLTYSIEYTSNYFTATIQDPNIAKIHIIPNNLQLMETVYSETITLTATDTFGNVSEQDIITITVRAFNDPPIYTGADILYYREDSEDVYLDLNTIFIDPEVNPSYPLSFQVAPHDVGIINTELNNDTLKLNFLENKNGDTQLSITATDVGNKSTTANIILRVNPVNDKPYAIPSQYPFDRHVLTIGQKVKIDINEPEDFRREYLINLEAFINDEEDARLDYSLTQSTNPQLFIGEIFEDNNTKWLRLQFLENASGTGRLIVTATDRDTSNPKILKVVWNVNINPVNDAPVATYTAPRTVNEDSIITGQLTGTDVDGDAITYSLVSPISGLTLNPNGSFSFDATHSDYQSLEKDEILGIRVNYKVTDIQGAEGTNSFTITVRGTNSIPVATYTAPRSVNEDAIITGQLTGTDADGDAITYSLVGSPIPGLTLNPNGSFSFDATHSNYQSLEKDEILGIRVNYKVTDIQGAEGTNSFTITVIGTNDIPVVTSYGDISVDEDENFLTGILTAYDLDDGLNIEFILINGPISGLTLYHTGSFTFDARHEDYQSLQLGEIQEITVNYKVRDSQGAEGTNSFTITVRGTNDIPVATYTAPRSVNEDAIITGQLTGTDADGDAITYSLVGSPIPGLTLNPNGSFSFDATHSDYQSLEKDEILGIRVNYKVTDIQGAEGTNSFTITVIGTNDIPVATYTAPRTVNEDSIISGQLTGTDADGDAITYSLVGSPIPGLTLNPNGSFSFDATHSDYQSLGEGAGQNIRVNYKVTDIQGAEGTNSFTITVIGTNDIPVATYTAPGSVNEDSIISGQLSGTDIDNGDTLTYSLVSSISGLTLNADGSFTFDASDQVYQSLEKNEILSIIVNYKVTDSQGVESETKSFTINVTGSNDTPVATYTTNRDVDEDATISGNLTATDAEGDAITYSLEKAVLGLTLYTDGRFTFNAGHEHYQSLEKDEILQLI